MASHPRNRLYIAGGPGGGSVGIKVHNHIAKSLGLNWTCEFLQLDSVDKVMDIYRAPDFAGGIVTMPHKRPIIPLLDHSDDLVEITGACNLVYLAEGGKLHGTNTDWQGTYDAIIAKSPDHVPGRTGMVYGAGGASRAAVYALWEKLKCDKIYLVNRDEEEVAGLLQDLRRRPDIYWPEVVHVKTLEMAKGLPAPYYIVSCVPDFEPVTLPETVARDILVEFLRGAGPKGLVLDMCYHPPMTMNLQLAVENGFEIVEGQTVVAAQYKYQWEAWTGQTIDSKEAFEMTERIIRDGH
ncbi:hypothetical protein BDV25DRAFT_154187 [Aspergillus avenaceus]|uniref:Shikimate dehydrogenase substrate binding N-terminal domain-containing protein n=1 Tax=Aspergillus avenaceus TaxID=36643 RepID=A0A5N6TWW9_ASPAV|nr:hypothetical protein BDV25DRAFT_154187 [Aspergillus avenaceus]